MFNNVKINYHGTILKRKVMRTPYGECIEVGDSLYRLHEPTKRAVQLDCLMQTVLDGQQYAYWR